MSKRLIVGRALRSEQLGETLLPKRLALPVFASDALSSNAYATQEILLVLSLGGAAFYSYAPWVAAAVVVIFFVVVASYRQNVHAYPSGGGDPRRVRVEGDPAQREHQQDLLRGVGVGRQGIRGEDRQG